MTLADLDKSEIMWEKSRILNLSIYNFLFRPQMVKQNQEHGTFSLQNYIKNKYL